MRLSDQKRNLTSPAVAAPIHSVVFKMLYSYVILQKKWHGLASKLVLKNISFLIIVSYIKKLAWISLYCETFYTFLDWWVNG